MSIAYATPDPIDRDQYAGYLISQGLSDQTVRAYVAQYVRWCDWCATTPDADPARPTPLTVRSWSYTLPEGYSIKAQARSMLQHLCDALEVERVGDAIRMPRQPRRKVYALDHEKAVELAAYAENAGTPGLAVLVGLYTAGRRAEIASLAWRRINFETRRLTLYRPKNRDLHTVPLHPHLAELLEARRVPGELWVFPGRYGGHVSPPTVWEWVLQVAEGAGLGHITPHQLRHTALTEAYDNTTDLRAVQDLAGHLSPTVTARYTRTNVQRLDAAVGALDYSAPRSDAG